MTQKVPGIKQSEIDKVIRGPKVKAAMMTKAVKVQDYWKSVSPVFDPTDPKEHRKNPEHGAPGDYRDSIVVEVGKDAQGPFVKVKTTDFKRFWIEFGTKTMPKRAPRLKTLARFKKRGST